MGEAMDNAKLVEELREVEGEYEPRPGNVGYLCGQAATALAAAIEMNERLVAALAEMVAAHSLQNVGLDASKRRLAAVKSARALLASVDKGCGNG